MNRFTKSILAAAVVADAPGNVLPARIGEEAGEIPRLVDVGHDAHSRGGRK